ncbi:MAG: alpha/beta hydrolase [Bradyrhizobiaceae bacterium]|nr:alpha/beta hydrolase [Bradyrhizobiaceae bacterium]
MPGEERFETIAGCRIRLLRGGKGAPLLYLHGAGGGGIWFPFMEKLAGHFEVLAPEHPGFGASETPEWLDNVGDLAYFYLDFIEKLGLKNVTLVGSSLGGWTAAEIAVRSCAPLKTLVLSCAAGIHVKGVAKGDLFLWSPEQTVRNMYFDQKFADQILAQPLNEEQQMAAAKNRLTTAKLAWQPRLYNPHLHKWLHRISAPTLILWGDSDKVIPPAYGPAYQALVPGSRLEVFKDCGHIPQVEKMEAWTDRIIRFAAETGR